MHISGRRMRRYGVFIPERSAFKGLTGQFFPQLWNRKEWVRFFVLWQTLFKQNSFRTKNWPVMKYLKQESVSISRTPKRVRL